MVTFDDERRHHEGVGSTSVCRSTILPSVSTSHTTSSNNNNNNNNVSRRRLPPPRLNENSCSSNSSKSQQKEQQDLVFGFVDGNFSSGEILNLQLQDKSFCMAYSSSSCCRGDDQVMETAVLLVVGTASSLDFYDASSSNNNKYALIHSLPCSSMISCVTWVSRSRPTLSSGGHDSNTHCNMQLLLATADLAGRIALYGIDLEILESQGPTLLYKGGREGERANHQGHNNNNSDLQIRSLDAGYCHYAGLDLLLIAAGDKSGTVTISSFQAAPSSQQQPPVHINTIELRAPSYLQQQKQQGTAYGDNYDVSKKQPGILGLAFELEQGLMATSTSGGLVQVHSLAHIIFVSNKNTNEQQHRTSATTTASVGDSSLLLWSRQNKGGAVRCVAFSSAKSNINNLLAYGGYDKTVVLVDTRQWEVSRELLLQGTVRLLLE